MIRVHVPSVLALCVVTEDELRAALAKVLPVVRREAARPVPFRTGALR